MIRILDNNALDALYKSARRLRQEHCCYVPPEIVEEFTDADREESWLRSQPLVNPRIDEADFLARYAIHINRYNGVSFYNQKGFGDVAILATLDILVGRLPSTRALSQELFPEDRIFLVSDDGKLRKATAKNFGTDVTVETVEEFLSRC
mgnify:CR=1 FL=1